MDCYRSCKRVLTEEKLGCILVVGGGTALSLSGASYKKPWDGTESFKVPTLQTLGKQGLKALC